MKILIVKNPNGDTRTAPKGITFEQFQEANDSHRLDVRNVMRAIADIIRDNGEAHDYTKKTHEKEFYRDFLATMNDGADFVNGEWYQLHIHKERHHPLSYCQEDINLMDIIEMVVDCAVAGLTRSGEVRPMEVNAEILQKAVNNTIQFISKMVEVVDNK